MGPELDYHQEDASNDDGMENHLHASDRLGAAGEPSSGINEESLLYDLQGAPVVQNHMGPHANAHAKQQVAQHPSNADEWTL
mgnify:CR=1 FL=1